MTTVDKLLLKIVAQPVENFISVAHRDIKVLKSLAKIVLTPNFITENQSRLLLKILNENSSKFSGMEAEIEEALLAPEWSTSFRPVDKTKKIYISQQEQGIVIEFAFSSDIRKLVTTNVKKISGLVQLNLGKQYRADLTERNIVTLVELLTPIGFEIDEQIADFYKTIKSWSENEVRDQFLLTNITHTNFQKQITADLGIDTPLDKNVINDRSVRYQYFVENPGKNPENLTEKIAFRQTSKVWVNKKETSLEEIFESLLKLNRLPALIVFDSNDRKKCREELENLHQTLEKCGIFDSVGIYFRLPNVDDGTEFNKFIADHQYNAPLDETTKVVGVQNGKIPKFFIKNEWKPMSVIAIGNSLRQTKTAVYANTCDLIISYTDSEPIIETRFAWE